MVMASSAVIHGWLDIMIDIAFQITPLVTAVGYEEVVFTSSLLYDDINGTIGITIFHLFLSYHTGIALRNHQYTI